MKPAYKSYLMKTQNVNESIFYEPLINRGAKTAFKGTELRKSNFLNTHPKIINKGWVGKKII